MMYFAKRYEFGPILAHGVSVRWSLRALHNGRGKYTKGTKPNAASTKDVFVSCFSVLLEFSFVPFVVGSFSLGKAMIQK
jgi:hypothetical protein